MSRRPERPTFRFSPERFSDEPTEKAPAPRPWRRSYRGRRMNRLQVLDWHMAGLGWAIVKVRWWVERGWSVHTQEFRLSPAYVGENVEAIELLRAMEAAERLHGDKPSGCDDVELVGDRSMLGGR